MPPIHRPLATIELLRTAFDAAPFTADDLQGLGLTRSQLRAAQRGGEVVALRHGVHILAAAVGAPGSADHHLKVAAAAQLVTPGAVATNGTARLALGLPSPIPSDHIPTLPTLMLPRGGGVSEGVLLLRGLVLPEHQLRVSGLVVSDLPRTAVDCARDRPLPEALVVLDAALRRLAISRRGHSRGLRPDEPAVLWARGQLLAAVGDAPGKRQLTFAVQLASALSESPAESWSRAVIHLAGLPVPVLQHEVRCDDGRTYRSDFVFLAERVLGRSTGGSNTTTGQSSGRRSSGRTRSSEPGGWWCDGPGPRWSTLRTSLSTGSLPLCVCADPHMVVTDPEMARVTTIWGSAAPT